MEREYRGVPGHDLRIRIKTGLIQALFSQGQIDHSQRDELLRLQRTAHRERGEK